MRIRIVLATIASCVLAGVGVGILLGLSSAPLVAATVASLLTAVLAVVTALGKPDSAEQTVQAVAALGVLVLSLALSAFATANWKARHPGSSDLERQYDVYKSLLGEARAKEAIVATAPLDEPTRLVTLYERLKAVVGEAEARAVVLERAKQTTDAISPGLPEAAKPNPIELTSAVANYCRELLSGSSAEKRSALTSLLASFPRLATRSDSELEQLAKLLCAR